MNRKKTTLEPSVLLDIYRLTDWLNGYSSQAQRKLMFILLFGCCRFFELHASHRYPGLAWVSNYPYIRVVNCIVRSRWLRSSGSHIIPFYIRTFQSQHYCSSCRANTARAWVCIQCMVKVSGPSPPPLLLLFPSFIFFVRCGLWTLFSGDRRWFGFVFCRLPRIHFNQHVEWKLSENEMKERKRLCDWGIGELWRV